MLVDPYRNSPEYDWFVPPFPPVEADIVLVTHDHFDHDAVEGLPGQPSLLRGPGELSLGDARISGLLDLHSGRSGMRGKRNTVFLIESEGVRYCHIGDNRHDIPEEMRAQLGRVDVLMVTVDDSCHLLTFEQVDSLVSSLSPRIVIPTHYYIHGLTTDSSTLLPADDWLATQADVLRLASGPVRIARGDLPAEREVWVFQPAPELVRGGFGNGPHGSTGSP